MTVRVRPASGEDHETLCRLLAEVDALHARLRPDFFRAREGGSRPQRELERALAGRHEALFVAEVDGRTVGLVHVKVYDTPDHPLQVQRRRGHVEDIVVQREYRRRGVGRAMMEAAAAWCERAGAEQLLLTVWDGNASAEAFYRRMGYRTVSTVLGLELTSDGG